MFLSCSRQDKQNRRAILARANKYESSKTVLELLPFNVHASALADRNIKTIGYILHDSTPEEMHTAIIKIETLARLRRMRCNVNNCNSTVDLDNMICSRYSKIDISWATNSLIFQSVLRHSSPSSPK